MEQNKIKEKLVLLLEQEVAVVEHQVMRDPALHQHLLELLEVQQYLDQVKEVPLIYG